MAKKKQGFSSNDACQPIYEVASRAIKALSRQQALEVVGELADHFQSMAEAIEGELAEEESE